MTWHLFFALITAAAITTALIHEAHYYLGPIGVILSTPVGLCIGAWIGTVTKRTEN